MDFNGGGSDIACSIAFNQAWVEEMKPMSSNVVKGSIHMKTVILNSMLAMALATAAFAQKSEVGKRAENQQDRIAQGVKSGSLTAGETARLETKEAAVNHEVRADR